MGLAVIEIRKTEAEIKAAFQKYKNEFDVPKKKKRK
jgi:hypothetical protein